MFLDRRREMDVLRRRHESPRAECLVLYGRRRVGKSELADRFVEETGGIRLLAREQSEKLQLEAFSGELAAFFEDEVLEAQPFTSWDAFFAYVARKAENRRLVLCLDEFPYLVSANRSLPSILQDHWDRRLSRGRLFLILCGSSIGMMEGLLGAKSPLYGRRTGQIRLRPLPFSGVLEWTGGDLEKAVEVQAVFGSTPACLLEHDPRRGILQNIRNAFLREDALLFRDVEFLLRQELRELRNHFSILSAIARGRTRLSEIVNDTGLDRGVVTRYLAILSDLHLVEREVPVTERKPDRSRKGLYRLSDDYFRFWFRFVHPSIQRVERGRVDEIVEGRIGPALSGFIGPVFERVVREAVESLGEAGTLPFRPERIGRWWDRREEIDVVALGEGGGRILFGEVKWSRGVDASRLLRALHRKTSGVARGRGPVDEHFLLVARSFKRKAPGAMCLGLRDLKGALER